MASEWKMERDMHDEIAYMPAVEMAAAIRSKALSPVEVTRALLERIDAVNPSINAYVLVTADMAMAQAEEAETAVVRGDELGPLHGVPVSIKDLFDVKGLPTTKGSLVYRENIATGYEWAAKRLLDAGAVHLGKTNTPEFGFLPPRRTTCSAPRRTPGTQRAPPVDRAAAPHPRWRQGWGRSR